jgi:hypothetical protein
LNCSTRTGHSHKKDLPRVEAAATVKGDDKWKAKQQKSENQ